MKDVYDLTTPQKSIFLTEKFYGKTNLNNVCGTFYSTEKLNFNTLKKSLNVFFKNNDSFKIKLKQIDGEIKQYFSDINDIDFEIVEIKNKEEQTALEEKIASEIFDLYESLLFKIVMFKYPDGHGGFVINSHHIISDSWTNGIIANGVALIYSKLKNNEEYSKDENLSYKKYIESEESYKLSSKFQRDKLYWEDVFSTVPEVATIPSIKNVSNNQESLEAKRLLIPFNDDVFFKIKTYCQDKKVSLYNFFMAVYALYIGRVSGLDEFVIGTPILNRSNFKEKQTTGMFINTLPLKINLVNEITFLENLKEISSRSMALLRHQKYSFQNIIENLRKKEPNLPKLYNILYSYQITKMNENMEALEHTTSWTFNKSISDDLDIHMFEWNEEDSIKVAYDYKINKYDEQDILDFHARILRVINQVIENENILLKDIEIITPEERHKILYKFNNTKVDYPKDKTIVDFFEEQVKKTPDNIAVIFEGKKLTYKQLNKKANSLARYLINEKNIRKNNIVLILLNRSIEMMVSILAVLKSGAAYLPIDPTYPEDRIKYIIDDSSCDLILTSSDIFGEKNDKIIYLDNINYLLNSYSDSNLNLTIDPEDISYIIYTSGSTGTPKGVILKHLSLSNLINYCNSYVEYLKNSTNKGIVSVTTASFDIFLFETLISLQRGLKLVIADYNEQTLPHSLNKLIEKEDIKIIQTTPSRMQLLCNNISSIPNLKNLEYIILAGEQLPITLLKYLKSITNAKIYNGYGPSETTVFATLTDVTDQDKITIGKPLPNTNIYIMDKFNNLCPIGIPGEIYISGDGVGNGYINKKDLTSRSFINDLFFPKQTMYKSGDIGFYLENGEIICLGRLDNQVKIRGLRIELEEIEKNILSISYISNCVVVKKTDEKSHEFLCAYYVSDKSIASSNIRTILQKTLPDYMVPQHFIKLQKLPYTPNGKVDKKALPMPKIDIRKIIANPRNELDSILIDIFKSELNLQDVGIDESFYTLGGDSLNAINISTSIYNRLNIKITVNDILKNQTIRNISDTISGNIKKDNLFNILPAKNMEFYPASSAQKRIYYSCLKDNNSLLYNIAGGITLDKKINKQKLEECFQTLIKRHSSLRTHFTNNKNNIIQIIDNDITFRLDYEQPNTDDINFIYSEFVKPFDLSKAPLMKAKLYKLSNNRELLLINIHHIISDGASLNILLKELCCLYNGDKLPEKNLEYKDYSVWEEEQINSNKFNKEKKYWIHNFEDDIPLLNMPTVFPRPNVQNFEGNNYFSKLDNKLYNQIADISKKLDITPYMLLLSVYYILLAKYTSQDDIVIGSPISGRYNPETSNLLGMFVNSLPLRNKINGDYSFTEFCNIIKTNCIESFKNGTYPFDKLVEDLKIKRDTSRNPIFDTMFTYQSEGYHNVNFNGVTGKYFIPNNKISKFDLSLEIVPMNNEYDLRYEYNTKLFNEDFIKRLSSHFINILKTVLNNFQIKINEIDMLSQEEKKQILYDFNNTKVPYPSNKTVIELFEEQVTKTPDNTAIIFEDQKLTYRELNEKANSLARFLMSNNAYTGDIICILLDKSVEMIVSILGILKLGATFLPIDINYPKERIDYIIRDSKSDILLTSQDLVNKANDTIQVLTVDLNNIQISQYSGENLDITYDTNNLAYVMYTSGSTGNPKGVMVNHKNIVRLVKNSNYVKFSNDEHILQTGSIVFDACTFEIWGALLNGYELYIIKKELLLDASYLKKYMKQNKITSLFITTQLFNQLIDSDIDIFESVSNVLTGGEAVSVKHMNKLNLYNRNINIIHCYGPTENTTFSTTYDVEKRSYKYTIPIGKPISNSTAYVVSSSNMLCPIGVPGELWVGGEGVAEGYLNNTSLTEEKFIINPFDNGKIYKTGDLVKWLPDGNIEFIGRIDNQVKVRGFRIELSEIDSKILEFPEIKYSTTRLNTINNEKVICSYFVAESGITIDVEKLKSYLKSFLPSYMIPTYIMQLTEFKMNINGKIDKNYLPTDFNELKLSKKIELPQNNLEKNILNIFKNVLNLTNISVTDDLFNDLNGDSLTAMKIQVEALSQNVNIAYSDIFKYPSIRELAKNLTHNKPFLNENIYNFDYSKYNNVLEYNTLQKPLNVFYNPMGNLLLTGFTGFLGAHVLDSFIKKETGKVYCLIRSKNNMSAKERLYNVLHFYFEDKYDDLVNDRIIVIDGDISFNNFGLSEKDYKKLGTNVNTIVHSAALVKHYGMYDDFKNANIIGTQNIVDFAIKFNLRLLHISTLSVSGNNFADGSNVDNHFGKNVNFTESDFYIGQTLYGIYAESKFIAEKIVLDAIVDNKLEACILRMGNLTSRFSEGKFQQNHFENAFVNRFKSFLQIGYIPEYMLKLYAEFTPIDSCGDAIIEIARHFNKDYTVFHLMNEKRVYLDRLFEMMKSLGINLEIVNEKKFIEIINNILADNDKKMYIEGIINDFDKTNKHLVYESEVKVKCDFSKEFLHTIGFDWPFIDINYIRNYFQYLKNIGYLNIN